ncbi:MAG: hypothetical protein ABSE63_18420 [Thermoguttaceae bacterium]
MKRILAFIIPAIVLLAFSALTAQDKFDPAAQAKIVTPYIDEQTFLIVHMDFSKVKIDYGMDALARLIPDDKEEILESKATLQQMMDSYIQAGGRDIYITIRANPRDAVLLVVPVGDKLDQHAIDTNPIFEPLFKEFTFKRVGGVILGGMANPQAKERLGIITPDTRPELAAASLCRPSISGA